ncbi:DNA polymerase zeta catalytic subunit isoform X2 [Rhodamnia argentea]|uniref:DNA polymerase zeta catalytic subunit n=1 Tax=Rhodamnia argentea TaxID=178133 RepID=A0ABM3HIE8_9MYRT|nr:DNA polymerase zeta catalytic subunit isoform X2 [Rhodamnia argentea]
METLPTEDSQPNTAPDSEDSSIFSVRIVSIDYYMASPIPDFDVCYSSFQGEKVNVVPVIRVYGSTPAGQKTCLHVHKALPYLYVPYADIPIHPTSEGDAFTNAVALAMEKALKLKGNAGMRRQHVHGCSLVRARRFYGYHASEELFVKIYLYHPPDVLRAAKLLLGGAVFDRSLQPHESHIPYLLQFLVDYNLYGMGLLHLMRIRFRHPIPDIFAPKRCSYNDQGGQVVLARDAHLETPVWISSTIPGSWRWQPLGSLDASSGDMAKRQSTCELEGDAGIDDIVNQQFKTYTSLSQARSDVKMVQSLVPIWEEEFERSGMHEAALPPDPGKPRPEDVLKVLSRGLDLEYKLLDLCSGVVSSSTPERSMRPLSLRTAPLDDGNLTELARAESSYAGRDLLLHLEEQALNGFPSSTDLFCGDRMVATSVKEKAACYELLNENRSSQLTQPLGGKVVDKEVLGLLKWLATSQAAEDINSDDELVRETILTPLLPTTTIDKVLEKANIEYESESQKECQDILDSIEDTNDFGSSKERGTSSAYPGSHSQASSEKSIPQVDGSSDGCCDSPCNGLEEGLSKMEKKVELKKFLQQQALDNNSKSSSTKKRKNSSLWGSLPFAMIPKVTNHPELMSLNMNDESSGGCEDQNLECSSSYSQRRLDFLSDTPTEKAESDTHLREASVFERCSVRDLMRKKRCHLSNPLDCTPHSGKRVDVFACPEEIDLLEHGNEDGTRQVRSCPDFQIESNEACQGNFNVSGTALNGGFLPVDVVKVPQRSSSEMHNSLHPLLFNEVNETRGPVLNSKSATSDVSSSRGNKLLSKMEYHSQDKLSPEKLHSVRETASATGSEIYHRSVHLKKSDHGTGNLMAWKAMPHENLEANEDTNFTPLRESFDRSDGELGQDVDFSRAVTLMQTTVDALEKPSPLIAMTLREKPPVADWGNEAPEHLMPLNGKIKHSHSMVMEHDGHEGTSGRALDEIPPFFVQGFREDKEVQSGGITDGGSNYNQEAHVGVPTHYQNDGSCLYLLTPVISPPSADIINDWLWCSEKGSPVTPIHSQETSQDDVNGIVPESGSLSHCKPSIMQVSQDKCGKLEAEEESSHSETATLFIDGKSTARVKSHHCSQDISQISGPDGKSRSTPFSQLGFRDPASTGGGQQLTLLSIEVQAESRGDLHPDPRFDAINIVALAVMNDQDSVTDVYVLVHCKTDCQRSHDGVSSCEVLVFPQENQLLTHFAKIVSKLDSDILVGWDVQGASLGYLAERASYLGIGLLNMISRVPSDSKVFSGDSELIDEGMPENAPTEPLMFDSVQTGGAVIEDEWGRTHASGLHVGGRIVLNVWRLVRGEVKHNMYTVEAIAEVVLRRKIPSFQHKVLTKWFSSGPGRARYRCLEYMIERAKLNVEIINQLDLVNRTAELARVFGIDFFSVLSRGSQYRVESMFLRLAHTQNYIAISPGNQQVASQPAMECLPLVMEPESGFYADPVIVLDFQSLYPSMIIAYNLCFCTCLGKVVPSKANTLGVASFTADQYVLRDLKDQMLLTPNGVMYVPPKVRKGILPRLLEEILSTRIMVKQAMKRLASPQQVLYRIFNARQLALKLIANVTYGYTAAGFSGRMPCAELADSIVQCGRRTLENAISFVNANDKWNAKVIYGDTDSMFVLLKGRTVKDAFRIGQEIVSAVNEMNPNPVALKMEKVYHPCFLLTKKRYVGYSYETPNQVEPLFDAKGIETVRRDTCGAVAKTMEQSLRIYFEHQDISKVKVYLYRQWTRILSGRVCLQDFVFAKEVRLGTYSTRPSSSLPPAAIVATKAMRVDPRAEPRYAERIPYVVVHGEPGARLVDMVVDPMEVLEIDSPLRLNELYYIKKQIIPALQRVFGLVGADLNKWFSEMPRPIRENFAKRPISSPNPQRKRIDFYYLSKHCILCGELVPTSTYLCNKCSHKRPAAATALVGRTSRVEREMQHLAAICRHCGGGDWILESGVKCTSLACPVFYERLKVQKELRGLSAVTNEAGLHPKCMVEWF